LEGLRQKPSHATVPLMSTRVAIEIHSEYPLYDQWDRFKTGGAKPLRVAGDPWECTDRATTCPLLSIGKIYGAPGGSESIRTAGYTLRVMNQLEGPLS
jgi:hypothetical protein